MKTMLLIGSLLFSIQTYANQDHEPGMEADPGESRVEVTRGCFNDLDQAGCGRPEQNRDHFGECAVDHKSDLKRDCQQLVKKLYQ